MYPSALIALGQATAAGADGPGLPGLGTLGQYGPMGAISAVLLALFGWLFKRLVDNMLRQNEQQNALQIAKLDEIKRGLDALSERVVGRLDALSEKMVTELGSTKMVLHAVADETVRELEYLRGELSAPARTTDTPLPAPLPRRPPLYRNVGTPIAGTSTLPRPGLTPDPKRRG